MDIHQIPNYRKLQDTQQFHDNTGHTGITQQPRAGPANRPLPQVSGHGPSTANRRVSRIHPGFE